MPESEEASPPKRLEKCVYVVVVLESITLLTKPPPPPPTPTILFASSSSSQIFQQIPQPKSVDFPPLRSPTTHHHGLFVEDRFPKTVCLCSPPTDY
jgi:hypothetical protein